MKVCTNSQDFYNYLQSKFVEVVFYDVPLAGFKNVFFLEQRNTLTCGNAYNKERFTNGKFREDCEEFVNLFRFGYDLVVLTGMTMLIGPKHEKFAPLSYRIGKALGINRQRIHTSQLKEVVCPRWIQIWSTNGTKLKSCAQYESDCTVEYGNKRRRQGFKDLSVFWTKRDKDERHKMRYVPEYALYSQLYHQLIEEVQYYD